MDGRSDGNHTTVIRMASGCGPHHHEASHDARCQPTARHRVFQEIRHPYFCVNHTPQVAYNRIELSQEGKKMAQEDYGTTHVGSDGLIDGIRNLCGQVNLHFPDGQKVTYSRVWRATAVLGIVKGLGQSGCVFTQDHVRALVKHFQDNPAPAPVSILEAAKKRQAEFAERMKKHNDKMAEDLKAYQEWLDGVTEQHKKDAEAACQRAANPFGAAMGNAGGQ